MSKIMRAERTSVPKERSHFYKSTGLNRCYTFPFYIDKFFTLSHFTLILSHKNLIGKSNGQIIFDVIKLEASVQLPNRENASLKRKKEWHKWSFHLVIQIQRPKHIKYNLNRNLTYHCGEHYNMWVIHLLLCNIFILYFIV